MAIKWGLDLTGSSGEKMKKKDFGKLVVFLCSATKTNILLLFGAPPKVGREEIENNLFLRRDVYGNFNRADLKSTS